MIKMRETEFRGADLSLFNRWLSVAQLSWCHDLFQAFQCDGRIALLLPRNTFWCAQHFLGACYINRVFHPSQLEAQFEPRLGPQLETKLEPEIRPISKLDVKLCLTPRSDIQLDPNLAPDFVPPLRLTHLGYATMPTQVDLGLMGIHTSVPNLRLRPQLGQVGVEIGAKLGLRSECVKHPIVSTIPKISPAFQMQNWVVVQL
jgi:hypothetical protein